MTSPDEQLRDMHARRNSRDKAMLDRIFGRHRGPEPDSGDGETLADPAVMLSNAVVDMQQEETGRDD